MRILWAHRPLGKKPLYAHEIISLWCLFERFDQLKTDPSLEDRLQKLFRSQKLGVLATLAKKTPYTNLIAFACSDDLRQIVFATAKTTRKFENMISNSSVSFFIDNRSNKAADFRKAMGVTAVGSVRPIRKNKNSTMMKRYLQKHPQLTSFLASQSCAFLCIDVKSIYVVERFQNVIEVHLDWQTSLLAIIWQ